MKKVIITHPIASASIEKLNLKSIHEKYSLEDKKAYYQEINNQAILYVPDIGAKQIPDEENDPSIDRLGYLLTQFQPDILIVGSNAVPAWVLTSWREAVGNERELMVIRRGVDTRAIAVFTAEKLNIKVGNLPGINSPYVAQHMLKYLELDKADKNKNKIAIIGVGNIGKVIVNESLKYNLNTHIFSPSLIDKNRQNFYLQERGINPAQVICEDSLAKVIHNATHVAIAIPWKDKDGKPQADLITAKEIETLTQPCKIVSASVPRIFSESALKLMDELSQKGKIFVRIDTAQRRAEEFKPLYPHLQFAHNEAFASPECQEALDLAMFALIEQHFQQ